MSDQSCSFLNSETVTFLSFVQLSLSEKFRKKNIDSSELRSNLFERITEMILCARIPFSAVGGGGAGGGDGKMGCGGGPPPPTHTEPSENCPLRQ